jgi:hypothetical protein
MKINLSAFLHRGQQKSPSQLKSEITAEWIHHDLANDSQILNFNPD